MDKIEYMVVYKERYTGDDRGIVTPVFSLDDEGVIRTLNSDRFPSGIFISRGYSDIDKKYEVNQLFCINEFHRDEQKSIDDGIDRYWAFGKDASSLPPNTLIPALHCKLPPKETGELPEDIKAPRGLFFIYDDSESKLYGPVEASTSPDGDNQVVEAKATPKLSFGADYVGVFDTRELSDILFTININGRSMTFLSAANDLAGRRHSALDFMSDRKLIRYYNNLGTGKNSKTLSKNEAAKLSKSISDFERQRRSLNTKDDKRLERLKTLLDRYINESDVGFEIIRDYFKSPVGKDFLESYVAANEESLLGDQISKIKQKIKEDEDDLRKNLRHIEGQISSKHAELEAIHGRVESAKQESEAKIQQLKIDSDEEIKALMRDREQVLQEQINQRERTLQEKTTELEGICERLKIANTIEAMDRQSIFYAENNKRLEASAKAFQDQLQDTDMLSKRISEYHVIGRVLKGGSVTQESSFEFAPVDFASSTPNNASDMVDRIRSYLDWDNGKTFSHAELSNLMISITQSFLTVLAGPPGVGKTSTVIRLAKALKIGSPDDHKNFLYMPVSRGWVSSRDILGFHNSLTNTYQRARTGLYDFLNRKDASVKALQMVLMDESNLAPMEHYWSEFLSLCDPEGRSRPIDTGISNPENRFLSVGNNVRFVATINHDATTERLSPRLIDRVPVITIDLEDDIDFGYETKDLMLDGAVDYELLERFFMTREEAELSETHQAMLETLIATLGSRDADLGNPICISHRKRAAITNYCAAAIRNELMDPDVAFDFAISQHLLPHIEGYGTKFRNRIVKFSEKLGKGYPRTARHLDRILASGNEFTGTYSFF